MANIFGWEFDPTPGFNIANPLRKEGTGALVESTKSHSDYNKRQAAPGGSTGKGSVGGGGGGGGGGGFTNIVNAATVSDPSVSSGAIDPAAKEAAELAALRSQILGQKDSIEAAYNQLFADIDALAKSRASEVEKNAGENIADLTGAYTSSIPQIESSYSALGAGDSTDTRDAKIGAKEGFDKSVEEVGKGKESDLAKIGNYVGETKADWTADQDSIMRMIARANDTEDLGDLRQARNSVEDVLGTTQATRAKLKTDEGARGQLSTITADGGRYESIKSALDNVMNSSLANGVKQAAVQAISNSADLTDEDKEKVKLQYGNIYDTPAA